MGRAIAAVVLGYLTMVVIVFSSLTGAYFALGANGTFQPGNYDVSPMWILVWFVVSLTAAIVGGYVCVSIAKQPKPAFVLAGFVLVLGALSAIPALTNPPGQKERAGDVSNLDAMQDARQPTWIALATPLIGAFGALVGARMKRA